MWSVIEWFGVITGFIYLWYEFRQSAIMWFVSIINAATYVFVYAWAKLYADMAFYIYNFVISFYGLYKWQRNLAGDGKPQGIEYQHFSRRSLVLMSAATVAAFCIIYILLRDLTDSPNPAFDAFTTSLSIVGAVMTAQRIIEHWIIWIVVDAASIILYYIRGLYPTMLLFAVYTAIALWGYFYWKKHGTEKVCGNSQW